jgi:tetratricopeptide (TPR) repeat protein
MKKIFFCFFSIVFSFCSLAQTSVYQTAEDGINNLLSNSDFVQEILSLEKSDFSPDKLDQYLLKYLPEYQSYKVTNTAIDFSKIYYANAEGASPEVLAGLLGKALDMNTSEIQNLKGVFSGSFNLTTASGTTTDLSKKLYESDLDPNVDYAVDLGVDFFQKKFGDGGLNSSLIDIGGGLLGNLLSEINAMEKEKLAKSLMIERLNKDQQVFNLGYFQEAEGNIYSGVSLKDKTDTGRNDLQLHYKARKSMPGNMGILVENVDYPKSVGLLNEVIELYKKNPARAYYLYMAYVDRALCKMQMNAYRAAVIDYYFAQKVLEGILAGKLPDQSLKSVFPKGYFDSSDKTSYLKGEQVQTIGTLGYSDLVNVVLCRAFAKYRSEDYKGAISDARIALGLGLKHFGGSETQINGYQDISKAIEAMAEFKLGHYNASFALFGSSTLSEDLIKDSDGDGITDFTDQFDSRKMQNPQALKESGRTLFYGFPSYFPFDIIQVKGLSYYKAGKLNEAIGIYENLVASETSANYKTFTKVGGDISAVLASLASFYYTKGDFTKSVSLLNKAIALDPDKLEYYFKRGSYKKANGQISEAEADFDVVKKPVLFKAKASEQQSVEYYNTAYEKALSGSENNAVFRVIKEAASAYPDLEVFYSFGIKYLNSAQNSVHADELAQIYKTSSPLHYHILKALSYSFAGDEEHEKSEFFEAFEKGASFYMMSLSIHPEHRILIQQKSYCCELMSRFMSRTNNSFISSDFDREKMDQYFDSLYVALGEQYSANKAMEGILAKQKREQKAKFLGDFEEYLRILESQKMLLEMSPIHAFDYVELLFILGKKDEAVSFAKKVVQKGKLMKSNELDPNSRFSNAYYYGLKNIAESNCQ